MITYEKIETFGIKMYTIPRPERYRIKSVSTLIKEPVYGLKKGKKSIIADIADRSRLYPGPGKYVK